VKKWRHHLRKHLGTNASNYFTYNMGGAIELPHGLYTEPTPFSVN
jgi:hypothetical protein